MAKKVPSKKLVGKIGDVSTKMILNGLEGHSCSIRTNLVSFKTLDVPYSPNQFLGWDFFATSYRMMALVIFVSSERIERKSNTKSDP